MLPPEALGEDLSSLLPASGGRWHPSRVAASLPSWPPWSHRPSSRVGLISCATFLCQMRWHSGHNQRESRIISPSQDPYLNHICEDAFSQ